MADFFISIPFRRLVEGEPDTTAVNIGAATTAGDWLELRWTTGVGVTRKDVIDFCERVIVKMMHEGGKDRAGTGVPPT